MPGHWGRSRSSSRGSAAPAGGPHGGGGQQQVTTAVAPPSILSKPAPTPVSTGGGRSAALQAIAAASAKKVLPPQLGGPSSAAQAAKVSGVPLGGAGLPPQLGGPSSAAQAAKFIPPVSPPVTEGIGARQFLHKLKLKQIREQNERKRRPTWKDWALSTINPWQLDDTYGEGDPTLGTRGIFKGLGSWFYDKGITSLQNLSPEAKVWMAHATEPDDLAKLTKTGFESIRPKSKWTNLLSPRSYEELLRGKNPLTSTGVYTAVGKTKEEAIKAAAQYGKPWYSRGLGKGVDASKVFAQEVARGTHPIHRGVTGVAQMEVPSHIANKAFNIGDKGLKVGAAPAKHLIKSTVGRMLPGANIALGGASALKHLQAGNYGQMAMAGLSMAPGPLGWLGLAGEMGLGALQKYRQNQGPDTNTGFTEFAAARGGLANLYRHGGFSG